MGVALVVRVLLGAFGERPGHEENRDPFRGVFREGSVRRGEETGRIHRVVQQRAARHGTPPDARLQERVGDRGHGQSVGGHGAEV